MKTRLLPTLCVLLLAWLVGLTIPTSAQGLPEDEAAATEDVIHMLDGRELHGQILEEKTDVIIFEYLDPNIKIKTKMTLLREEIAHIQRDIAIAGAVEAPERTRIKTGEDDEEESLTYGARKIKADEVPENVTTFYLVPMKGQMGTDINDQIYREMIDDIKANDPDYLIIEMDCRIIEGNFHQEFKLFDQGLLLQDMYRDLVNLFHDDLREFKQVLWVRDSQGPGSVIMFAWNDIYMHSGATMWGLGGLYRSFMVADPEVRAKFREASMAWAKGIAEYGDTQLELLDALIRPEMKLSGTWKGREIHWSLDTNGQYVVDGSDEHTLTFKAKEAEDFCITDGTADTLDDLALLLGIREYHVLDADGEAIFDDYCEDWRRTLENCKRYQEDYMKYLGWAGGEDALKYLGQAKNAIVKIIAGMKRYRAVEIRMQMERGVSIFQLEVLRDDLIRAIKEGRGGGIGGGGRGGSGSGRGSPGPG